MKKNIKNSTIIPDSLFIVKIWNYERHEITICGLATSYKTAKAIVRDFHPSDDYDWWEEWGWDFEIKEAPYAWALKYLLDPNCILREDMICYWDIRVYPYCKRKWRNEMYL